MKCFDKKGNEVPDDLLLASRDYPDHAITMLAAIAEYEAKLRELEGLDESSLSK
jgi:hypothetical protein